MTLPIEKKQIESRWIFMVLTLPLVINPMYQFKMLGFCLQAMICLGTRTTNLPVSFVSKWFLQTCPWPNLCPEYLGTSPQPGWQILVTYNRMHRMYVQNIQIITYKVAGVANLRLELNTGQAALALLRFGIALEQWISSDTCSAWWLIWASLAGPVDQPYYCVFSVYM